MHVIISKHLTVVRNNLVTTLVDCIPALIIQVTSFGYLLPLLGMSPSLIAPNYLGGMIAIILHIGYSQMIKTGFDLEQSRFIDYHLTLPLDNVWLFASYIISDILEMTLVFAPLLTVGIALLHNHFTIAAINWFLVASMWFLIATFFSTFFFALAYNVQVSWLIANGWPRTLSLMWWFGGALVPWQHAYNLHPWLAYGMLLNPFTYVSEGLRAAFLGNTHFIAWYWCATMLLLFRIANCCWLAHGVKKRLDPV